MRMISTVLTLVVVSLLTVGCGDGGAGDAILKRRSDLAEVAAAFQRFAAEHERSPADVAELTGFMAQTADSSAPIEHAMESLGEGEIVVNYGGVLPAPAEAATFVLAFEARAPASGGYVVMADGTVRLMTGKEFSTSAMLPTQP